MKKMFFPQPQIERLHFNMSHNRGHSLPPPLVDGVEPSELVRMSLIVCIKALASSDLPT